MRVLITGGFGFVGGRLGQHLIDCGYEVILGSRKFQEVLNWLPSAEVVQTDWNNKVALFDICEGVDVVIHTAGMNAQECVIDPDKAIAFNGNVTANLVKSAVRQGVQKFIYLSTAHVYRSPLVGTISEYTETTNTHPYATSHLAGEAAVLEASMNREIDGVIIRLSNAFGAPAHSEVNCWMLLINDLCRQAMTSGKMVIKSSGKQHRDFISLHDIAAAVDHFLFKNSVNWDDGLFNLGGDCSLSIIDVANKISSIVKKKYGTAVPRSTRSLPEAWRAASAAEHALRRRLHTPRADAVTATSTTAPALPSG